MMSRAETQPNTADVDDSLGAAANSPVGIRDRLFHVLFVKFALSYSRVVPVSLRRLFECFVLLKVILN